MTLPLFTMNPFFRLLTACLSLSLNALALAEDNTVSSFDKALVTGIDFKIAVENLDQFGFTSSESAMSDRIINNLAGWNFPMHRGSEKAISHTLVATVGQVTYQSTPTGFSFSAGNSDPRAPEFQKADVITVGCRLASLKNPQQAVELSMDFAADPITKALKKHKDKAKAADLLVDHISTVCFNLLDDLELEEISEPSGKPLSKPGWMPEIRIETQEQPAAENKPDAPGKTSESVPGKTSEAGGEKRKKIIIHNQGTPVILKLGHERL